MTRLIRTLATLVVAGTATAAVVVAANPAAAAPDVTVTWNVDAHTHLAKMGSDVSPPRGSFTGTIDLATGNLDGNLSLPPATITMYRSARSPPPTPASPSTRWARPPGTSTSHRRT